MRIRSIVLCQCLTLCPSLWGCTTQDRTSTDSSARLVGMAPAVVVTAQELGVEMKGGMMLHVREPAQGAVPRAGVTISATGMGWNVGFNVTTETNLLRDINSSSTTRDSYLVDWVNNHSNQVEFANLAEKMDLLVGKGSLTLDCGRTSCKGDFAFEISETGQMIHGTISGEFQFMCSTLEELTGVPRLGAPLGASSTDAGNVWSPDTDFRSKFCSKFKAKYQPTATPPKEG
jgi:hypothetical protein